MSSQEWKGGGEMSDDENNEWAAGELMFFDLIKDEQSEENIWACARHRRYGDASPWNLLLFWTACVWGV